MDPKELGVPPSLSSACLNHGGEDSQESIGLCVPDTAR